MHHHYLAYWRYDTVAARISEPESRFDHAASEQLHLVKIGDIVWVVTVPPRSGQLLLVGRMNVGWIGGKHEAAERLHVNAGTLWDATWHIIASEGSDEPFDVIDISGVAGDLRFDSERDRLTLQNGRINAQQLQSLRRLQPASASLLDDIWYEGADIPSPDIGPNTQDVETLIHYSEGRKKLRSHYQRERNGKLVQDAKQRFKQTHGRLFCEVCHFDFERAYGEHGGGYIEAHHKTPFADLTIEQTEVSVNDLVMVCANCHRMIHRKKPWLTIEQIREIVQKSKTD